MEKKSYIYPGTVFTAKNYDPFTKKILIHPFVCVYNQALDPNLNGETNIIALLITSNSKQLSRQIPILKSKNSFLDKDSYCYSNNIYMFLKEDATVIGQLDSDTFFAIVQKRQLMLRGENDQCVQSLMNMKVYESKMTKAETSTTTKTDSKISSFKKDDHNGNKHVNKSEAKHNKPKEALNPKITKESKAKVKESRAIVKPKNNNKEKQKNRTNNYKKQNFTLKNNKTISKSEKNTVKKPISPVKKKKKIIQKGPVIIGEPNQQKFKVEVKKKQKKKSFWKNKKKKNNRDIQKQDIDKGYIES